MSIDEVNDEKPRVYQSEGGGDRSDIVHDDKADVSRIAQDEVEKTVAEVAAGVAPAEPPTSMKNGSFNLFTPSSSTSQSNGLNYKPSRTAFNPVNSLPFLDLSRYTTSQLVLQRYYDGLLLAGSRLPFINSNATTFPAAALVPPLYGVTVCSAPWLSALSSLDASKTGIYAMGWQVSPNFNCLDHHQLNVALNGARANQSPYFQPSPLQSPDTGAPIVPLASKVPSSSMMDSGSFNTASSSTMASQGLLIPKSSSIQSKTTSEGQSTNVGPFSSRASSSGSSFLATSEAKIKPNLKPSVDPSSTMAFPPSAKRACLTDQNGLSTVVSTSSKLSKDSIRKSHIKKPLNAFMIYMKEMRPKVMEEAGLKERQSAEINRLLGKRWRCLSRADQQQFYDLARLARQEHLQKYPGWSARDNYALHKRRKKKREKHLGLDGNIDNGEAKKCRARFGLDQQAKWCKHCRRKKKCLWFKDSDAEGSDAGGSTARRSLQTTVAPPSVPISCQSSIDNGGSSASKVLPSKIDRTHFLGPPAEPNDGVSEESSSSGSSSEDESDASEDPNVD